MRIPRKAFLAAPFVFLLLCVPLQAQEGGDVPVEPDWVWEDYDPYAKGDKIFAMTLGAIFPVLFLDNNFRYYSGDSGAMAGNINVGGTGSLAFFYFLTPRWFLGGEVQGMFASTLGGNMIYIVPIGVRGGYQFVLGNFEFPLSLMIGGATSLLGDFNYWGFFIKPEASAFWRFHRDWSAGINVGWWFVPQWPKNSDESRYGNFVELTVSLRYHF